MTDKTKIIYVINGPNLNMLGMREPKLYGSETLPEINDKLLTLSKDKQITFCHIQSNHEGILIDFLHDKYTQYISNQNQLIGLIVNLAAYSHTSIALFDTLLLFKQKDIPIYEVHLTDISARETFRQNSFVSNIASEVIMGLGAAGYEKALFKIFSFFDDNSK